VADCILLYSLDFLEAFPIDTWIRKGLEKIYFSGRKQQRRKWKNLSQTILVLTQATHSSIYTTIGEPNLFAILSVVSHKFIAISAHSFKPELNDLVAAPFRVRSLRASNIKTSQVKAAATAKNCFK